MIDALDAKNMLLLSKLVVKSALIRKESRGAHYRKDHPKQNKKWLKHVIFKDGKYYFKKTPKPKGKLAKMLEKQLKIEYHYVE